MTERGILFSAPMVRAILAGTKAQTRRIVRFDKPVDGWNRLHDQVGMLSGSDGMPVFYSGHGKPNGNLRKHLERTTGKPCPYGCVGDRLWVRETWGVGSRPTPYGDVEGIEYRADADGLGEHEDLPLHQALVPEGVCLGDYATGWKPSIHMPRWASRITLEITGVRVERLQSISTMDAMAEGVEARPVAGGAMSYTHGFRVLWDEINAKRAPWSSNPWVWVVAFKRIDAATEAA